MPQTSEWSFLVDENTSRTLVSALRAAGYVAEHDCGIIVLRLPNSTSVADLIHQVQNALETLKEQSLAATLVIVEKGRIRVRR